MKNLATYIAFHGNTKEAFEFYHSVFGGDLDILQYGQIPEVAEQMPFDPSPDGVAHAVLALEGGTIAGGDAMLGETYAIKDTVYSLLYSMDDPDEAEAVFQKIADGGGAVNMPFEHAPWGGYYGQVFDRFGVMWAFSVDD